MRRNLRFISFILLGTLMSVSSFAQQQNKTGKNNISAKKEVKTPIKSDAVLLKEKEQKLKEMEESLEKKNQELEDKKKDYEQLNVKYDTLSQ